MLHVHLQERCDWLRKFARHYVNFVTSLHKWKVIQEAEYQTIFIVYSIGTTNNVQKSEISANVILQILSVNF